MSKPRTLARLSVAASFSERVIQHEVERRSLEPLTGIYPCDVVAHGFGPRNSFERTCIGCGAKVIPGLTDCCNH
jgi:hypothetical protein